MRVYISYSIKDKEIAEKFYDELAKNNIEVWWDENIVIGQEFNKVIDEELLKSDAIIIIISKNSVQSDWIRYEMMTALGYKRAGNGVQIFPFVIGNYDIIPDPLKTVQCYFAKDDIHKEIQNAVMQITKSLAAKFIELKKNEKNKEIVKKSFDNYIDDVFDKLDNNEKRNRRLSYICYGASITFIILSVVFSIYKSRYFAQKYSIEKTIYLAVLNVLTLALIIGLSRLLFILGKSFMVESIRNGDRIHAISFGKFFLNAYGEIATRDEIREVFGNWNIDNGSSFITQDTKDFDPQILEAFNVLKSAVKKD